MLTGLIIACEEVAGGAMLRAELPVAGQTVLEQQARLLADSGAERVIAIAAQLPQGLAAAVNRLRRDGITVEIVRQVDDVAQRVRPDERLLMLADGVVTDRATIEQLLAGPVPAILTLAETPATRDWELIDATARWGGVLLADGDLVRRTARMLGDWDLQSTLLRNAIQAGAERCDAGTLPGRLLTQVDDAASALIVEQAIIRGTARQHSGIADRFLFDPLARLIAPRAMGAMVDPAWLRGGAMSLMLLAAIALIGGWRWTGVAAAMLAGPVDALGRHLGALTMRLRRDHRQWRGLRDLSSGVALLALGWNLREYGWGMIAIAGATIGFMAALSQHETLIGKSARRPIWIADSDTLAWMIAPFALAGWWTAGMGAQAALAFGSLIAVQRLAKR